VCALARFDSRLFWFLLGFLPVFYVPSIFRSLPDKIRKKQVSARVSFSCPETGYLYNSMQGGMYLLSGVSILYMSALHPLDL